MKKARISDIKSFAVHDGDGIRTTVFFKGCPLKCLWCHNPEGLSQKPELAYYGHKCIGCGEGGAHRFEREKCIACGKCVLYCPHNAREICGEEYTVDEVMREILKDKAFYENSGGGVTFSGGECMLQIDFLEEILKECKRCGLHTAVDTAGHVAFASFERILPYTDLFLYDIKCYDSEKHNRYTGASNDLILSNLKKILQSGKAAWVRIPIIPTVNDSEEEMRSIKDFLITYGHPEKVELLPYHAMGEHKYTALGKGLHVFSVPSEEKMTELKKIFS